MTMTVIGIGTIMIVIMIFVAPGAAQEKTTPLGHPVPITEAGSDPPTEVESIILLRGPTDK